MLITYNLKCFTMLYSDLGVCFQSNGSSNRRIWQAHATDGDAAQVLSGTHSYPTQMLTPHKCSHYSEVLRLSGLDGADFMLSALNCSLIPSQVNVSYNKFAIQEYTFSQSLSIILLPPLTHALVSPCQTLRGRWQTSKQAWSRWLRKMSGKSFEWISCWFLHPALIYYQSQSVLTASAPQDEVALVITAHPLCKLTLFVGESFMPQSRVGPYDYCDVKIADGIAESNHKNCIFYICILYIVTVYLKIVWLYNVEFHGICQTLDKLIKSRLVH